MGLRGAGIGVGRSSPAACLGGTPVLVASVSVTVSLPGSLGSSA